MQPITEAELRRWQLKAYATLGDLLKAKLPPINWSVNKNGIIHGEVGGFYDGNYDEQRAIWEQWAKHVGGETQREYRNDDFVMLTIVNDEYGPRKSTVAILAKLYIPEDSE